MNQYHDKAKEIQQSYKYPGDKTKTSGNHACVCASYKVPDWVVSFCLSPLFCPVSCFPMDGTMDVMHFMVGMFILVGSNYKVKATEKAFELRI